MASPPRPERAPLGRFRKILFAVAVIAGLLVLVALAGEMILSATGARFDIAVEQAAFRDYHARAGATQQGRDPDTRQTFPIVFNQFGLRDATSRRDAPASDRVPVLVLGDSFVENLGLPWDRGFVAQLERAMRATDSRVEVISGGLGGIGTDREFDLLRELAPSVKPRLVILLWFNNDLWDITVGLHMKRSPPRWLQRSYLFQFLTDRLSRLTGGDVPQEKHRLLYAPFFTDGERDPLIVHALDRTGALLAQMNDYCRGHDAQFAVVAAPNAISFSPITTRAAYAETAAALGRKLTDFRPGLPYYLLAQAAAARRIAVYPFLFIDFERALAGLPPQTEETRRRLFFVNDPHWNANGCRIAAQAVARWLATR
jgi:hypothetical protein